MQPMILMLMSGNNRFQMLNWMGIAIDYFKMSKFQKIKILKIKFKVQKNVRESKATAAATGDLFVHWHGVVLF